MQARKATFNSLLRCEKAGRYTNIELDSAIKKYGLEEEERALYTALVYGVTERAVTLDYIIGRFSSLPDNKIAPAVRVILRLGIYQLLFLDRVPDHAAVSESVELAKTYCRSAAPFVNAILRRTVREREDITYPTPAVKYGIREDMYGLFREQYGEAQAERICVSFCEPTYLTLHANTLKVSASELREHIECESELGSLAPDCVRLTENMPISDFAPLEDGLCYVQDESSAYAVSLLGAQPGMTVIDTCACPGGKSFALALQMKNEGTLISCDLHENKLSLCESGAKRLGIDIMTTRSADGRVFIPEYEGVADRVLCDVPCSGFGVLGKKPDLRHKSIGETEHLPRVQYAILENCSRYVKSGGVLLYSTCTLNKRENEEVAERFLCAHPEFEPYPANGEYMRTIFPYEYGSDGFFFCRMLRK